VSWLTRRIRAGSKEGFFFFLKKKEAKKTFIQCWLALPAWVAGTRRAALQKVFLLLFLQKKKNPCLA
jgi:hypothetical protein